MHREHRTYALRKPDEFRAARDVQFIELLAHRLPQVPIETIGDRVEELPPTTGVHVPRRVKESPARQAVKVFRRGRFVAAHYERLKLRFAEVLKPDRKSTRLNSSH